MNRPTSPEPEHRLSLLRRLNSPIKSRDGDRLLEGRHPADFRERYLIDPAGEY